MSLNQIVVGQSGSNAPNWIITLLNKELNVFWTFRSNSALITSHFGRIKKYKLITLWHVAEVLLKMAAFTNLFLRRSRHSNTQGQATLFFRELYFQLSHQVSFVSVGFFGLSSSQRDVFESNGLGSAFQIWRRPFVRHVEETFGGKFFAGGSNSLRGCWQGSLGTKG